MVYSWKQFKNRWTSLTSTLEAQRRQTGRWDRFGRTASTAGGGAHTRPRRNRPSWPCRVFLALGQSTVFNFHQPIYWSQPLSDSSARILQKYPGYCKNIRFLQHLLFPGRSMIGQDRGMMFALHAVRERAVSRSRNNFDGYISEFRFWKQGDVKSIELYNYAGRVETRLRTEGLWVDLFHQIKPWNARWRARLGSCLLWRRAVCGCAQILYRVPSPRNVISGHTMSNRHVWGQIQNLFIRPSFTLFLFHHLLSSVRLLHIYTPSSSTRKG